MTIFDKIKTPMKSGIVTMLAALFAATLMARAEDASARRDYRIFPTNSLVQLAFDWKAIEAFSPIAKLKDAFGAETQLAEAVAGGEFLRENISYYAIALMPTDSKAGSTDRDSADEDDDDAFKIVTLIGFGTNVTMEVLDQAVVSGMKSASEKAGGAKVYSESLPKGLLRVSVTNDAPPTAIGGGEEEADGPQVFYLACADESLAVAAADEAFVRKVVDDIRAGCVFCPEIPAKHPLFWLSTVINPNEIFGGDKGDGDDGDADADEEGDDEASVLETMPFLRDLSRITATAEGVSEDESVRVVASAKFASPQGAAAAATALRPLLAFLPQAGDDTLAQLAARAKIGTSGDECRVTLTFSREDVGRLINSVVLPRE